MICDSCGGRRVVQGFGGIRNECKVCNGTGKVDDKPVVLCESIDQRSRAYRELKKQQEA